MRRTEVLCISQFVVEQVAGDAVIGSEKERLFAAAHLFVLPSYSENFGTACVLRLERLPWRVRFTGHLQAQYIFYQVVSDCCVRRFVYPKRHQAPSPWRS